MDRVGGGAGGGNAAKNVEKTLAEPRSPIPAGAARSNADRIRKQREHGRAASCASGAAADLELGRGGGEEGTHVAHRVDRAEGEVARMATAEGEEGSGGGG